jgi:EmrB/QacA subfamily drug resistance transporter
MPALLTRRAPARIAVPAHDSSKTPVLLIVLACQLMIVLDVSIVLTALPSIEHGLGFSTTTLSWVQNAYTLVFGGLLLLGARAGDLLGRRRTFAAGIGVFTLASLAGGLAQSAGMLLAARALQGVGAAIAAPAALTLLTVTFTGGLERVRAISWFAAVSAAGGSVGLVLGGLLTAAVSWRLGLLINLPVGAALIWLAPRHLPETARATGRFDLGGAASSTFGVGALVYGFVRAASDGWGDPGTVAAFASGLVLLATFVVVERRAAQPIVPLRLLGDRERTSALVIRMLVVGANFSSFFFLTQWLQGIAGYSALGAGLAFLPMTVVMFAAGRIVPALTPRFGERRLLIGGLVLAFAGTLALSRVGAHTGYLPGVALGMVVFGLGMGVSLAPLTAAGIRGVDPEDAGAASGLVNVAHQVGGSLGLAILITVFAGAHGLAGGISDALTGSALMLSLAVATAVFGARPALRAARVPAVAER